MYDVCHPSYYKIGKLGCRDNLKVTTAFYVYIELCEGRKLWDVKYEYDPVIDLIYLTGKTRKNGEDHIYVPWPTKTNIKLGEIERIGRQLKCERFTLVLKSGETSSIFYYVREGLVKPLAPEVSKELKSASSKKHQLRKELERNGRNLHDLAKAGKDGGAENKNNIIKTTSEIISSAS